MTKQTEKSDKRLKYGCVAFYCWSGINLFLSALILFLAVSGLQNSPLFSMVFEPAEVVELPPKVIGAMNALTILYNSYAAAMSVLVCRAERFERQGTVGVLGMARYNRYCRNIRLYCFCTVYPHALAGQCCAEPIVHNRCGFDRTRDV